MLLADQLSSIMIKHKEATGRAFNKGFVDFRALQKQKSLVSSHFDRFWTISDVKAILSIETTRLIKGRMLGEFQEGKSL